jgi:hypothetical protein
MISMVKATCKNLFFVVSHKVTPADRTISNMRWLDVVRDENVANGWLRSLETKFDELALDFAVSPARVFPGKSENEILNFLTGR